MFGNAGELATEIPEIHAVHGFGLSLTSIEEYLTQL
jgi:hypothetical protein